MLPRDWLPVIHGRCPAMYWGQLVRCWLSGHHWDLTPIWRLHFWFWYLHFNYKDRSFESWFWSFFFFNIWTQCVRAFSFFVSLLQFYRVWTLRDYVLKSGRASKLVKCWSSGLPTTCSCWRLQFSCHCSWVPWSTENCPRVTLLATQTITVKHMTSSLYSLPFLPQGKTQLTTKWTDKEASS